MALLYAGSLSKSPPPQDFKLQPRAGSLIHFLKSQTHTLTLSQRAWVLVRRLSSDGPLWGSTSTTYRSANPSLVEIPRYFSSLPLRKRLELLLKRNAGTLPRLLEDLNSPFTVFNSSTIGTYFLFDLLTEVRRGLKFRSPRELKKTFFSKLNLGGT